MRIVLLHAPPFKIPHPDQETPFTENGPPKVFEPHLVNDPEYKLIPYGLLSLGAQAKTAGHETHVLNVSDFPWQDLELLVRNLDADFWGMTCLTINRRGVDAVSKLIRQHQPKTHISVGGPHATAIPRELLEHYEALDTVVIGEGEATFMEMLAMLKRGEQPRDLPGLAWRENGEIVVGEKRERIKQIDELIAPSSYYKTSMIITSRGCPGDCTFCNSKTMWGKRISFHSADYVLDMLENLVARREVPFLAFSDDTFTANTRRALDICQGIIDRKLNFLWDCMTRVDAVNDELLEAMRLAGCTTLNLGVESTDADILRSINKRITADQVLKATEMAKKYGYFIRHFMMAGNRFETPQTLQASLGFLHKAGPHQAQFNLLSHYPGTAEYDMWVKSGGNPEVFFTHDFLNPSFPMVAEEHQQAVLDFLTENEGKINIWNYSVQDCEAIVARLPDLHLSHMEMGMACHREGLFERAIECFERALELDFPSPHVPLNNQGVCHMALGEPDDAEDRVFDAQQEEATMRIMNNLKLLDDWREAGENMDDLPVLKMHMHYESNIEYAQPMYPVPFQMQLPGFQHVVTFGTHWQQD